MARRKRKSRRKGLRGLGCDCGRGLRGLGMETPAGYLTVQGKPAPTLQPASSGGGMRRLLVGGAVLAATAAAGWYGWKWWQARKGPEAVQRGLLPGQITPRQMTEAEAAAGGA